MICTKLGIALLFVTMVNSGVIAQSPQLQWYMGNRVLDGDTTRHTWTDSIFGHTVMDWTSGELRLWRDHRTWMGLTSSGQSHYYDEGGVMRLLSNGSWLSNASGDTISSVWPHTSWDYYENGNWLSASHVFIPKPGADDVAILLNENLKVEEVDTATLKVFSSAVYAFEVEMTSSGDRIVSVDSVGYLDEYCYNGGSMYPIPHANGQDWWLWRNRIETDIYDVFLIDASGYHYSSTFSTGLEISRGNETHVLSADASKLVMLDDKLRPERESLQVSVYDVDRCTGRLELSDVFWIASYNETCGIALSSDGRYGYVAMTNSVWQFDMWSDDKEDDLVLLVYEDTINPCPPRESAGTFNKPVLGPDGKIYIHSYNFCKTVTVIDYPERGGLNCGIRPYGLLLPSGNNDTYPLLAPIGLGPLPGSPCLTDVDEVDIDIGLSIYPVPMEDDMTISWQDIGSVERLSIYDLHGRSMLQRVVRHYDEVTWLVEDWAAGVYVVVLSDDYGRVMERREVIKQ